VSDRLAAADTELNPNRTRTTEGKQHMVARRDDDRIALHSPFSMDGAPSAQG
jgi:hypothetical protein